MKLIVGLGNPGEKYMSTRHNVGFRVIDQISKNGGFFRWKKEKKFKSEVSSGNIVTEKILLIKPRVFMNNSGESVSALVQFYKIHLNDIMIIHDDLDLPLATIRISQNTSSGGHKGVQSIIDYLHSQEFIRFRIGIRGAGISHVPAEEYVLQKFPSDELTKIDSSVSLLIEAVEMTISLGVVEAMNEFN